MLRIMATLLLVLCTSFVVCSQSKSSAWLNGTWEGTGYQIDDNSTWSMRLTVRGKGARSARAQSTWGASYLIEYPSLKCGGRWRPISISSNTATFREILTFGQTQCADNGGVVIERLRSRQIAFRYSNQGAAKVSASAILDRKK